MHVRILTRHSKDGRTKPDHSTSLPPSVSSATQSCLTLCNPLNCSPTDSSVHGILQARILEWVAMLSSRRSSPPRIKPKSLMSRLLASGPLPLVPPGKPLFSICSVQLSSVIQLCPTLCDSMNRSTPGLPVHHQLPDFIQTHVHRVCGAIQPSHPRLYPSPPAPNPSQHQSLFQ